MTNRSSNYGITKPTIRWIAFDAVGTLIKPNPSVAAIYHKVGRQFSSRLTEDEVGKRFRMILHESESADSANGNDHWRSSEPQEREKWREIVGRVLDDTSDPSACFEILYNHFAQPSAWDVFPDVPATLAALNSMGYRLAVASNFDSRLHAVLDGKTEFAPIERRVISSEVGFRKPSACFFESLCTITGSVAEGILLVGDDEVNDVNGAREAGLAAIHVQRNSNSAVNGITSLQDLLSIQFLADRRSQNA